MVVTGCAGPGDSLSSGSQLPTCQDSVTIESVVNSHTLRLADGRIVELAMPQLFLQAASPDQPDYDALDKETVAFLTEALEGQTVTADLSGTSLSLCGQDRVLVGTGLVANGLLYLEQATGHIEAASRERWEQLEALARQRRRGLWKKGMVGARPYARVTRFSIVGFTGEQTLDEISSDGLLSPSRRRLTLENIKQLRAIVAESAIVTMPRSPNFWQLCCNIDAAWFRVYYPREEGAVQAADYIESAELATFFRRIFPTRQ